MADPTGNNPRPELLQHRYVSDLDPSYLRDREQRREQVLAFSDPFGHEVRDCETSEDDIDVGEKLRDQLMVVLQHRGTVGATEVRSLFREGLTDHAVRMHPAVQAATRGMVGDPTAPAKLLTAIWDNQLPPEVIAMVARRHVQTFERQESVFHDELAVLQTRFRAAIDRLVSSSKHALTADMLPLSLVEGRMQEVPMIMADPLHFLQYDVYLGEFDAQHNMTSMVYDSRQFSRREAAAAHEHVYNHEYWHALSGREIVRQGRKFYHTRIGLRSVNLQHPEQSVGQRGFRWLNEGVTEMLTLDSRNIERWGRVGTYHWERQILKRLLRHIPEDVLLKAYFDNTRTQAGSLARIELEEAVEQAHGVDLLDILDADIGMYGAQAVARQFDITGRYGPVEANRRRIQRGYTS